MESIVIPPIALSERVVEGILIVCGRYLNNTEKTNYLMTEDSTTTNGYTVTVVTITPFCIKKWLNYFTEFSHIG